MTHAYPLKWPQGWKRQAFRRSSSPFKTTFGKAREDLYDELQRLGAKHVVISSNIALKLDGQPRADTARMVLSDPGVAVFFELRGHPMVMARDEYRTVHDNLRSIGLAISHLRGMERHGGAAMMERAFEGFAAISSPDAIDCFVTLGVKSTASADEINAAFKEKARRAHPDVGGSHELMSKLSAARDLALRSSRAAA